MENDTVPQTHDFGPINVDLPWLQIHTPELFWHFQSYPKRKVQRAMVIGTPPLSETSHTNELYEPWRTAHGRTLRLPLTRRAIVVGYWDEGDPNASAEDETDKLIGAIEGASIPGVTATEISDWNKAVTPLLVRVKEWLFDRLAKIPLVSLLVPARVVTVSRDSVYDYDEYEGLDPDIPHQGPPAPLRVDEPVIDLMGEVGHGPG